MQLMSLSASLADPDRSRGCYVEDEREPLLAQGVAPLRLVLAASGLKNSAWNEAGGHKHRALWHEPAVSADPRTDDELVAERRPGHAGPAFAAFYERHERAVLAYFRRRVPVSDAAVDLTAETFAQALVSRARYEPQPGAAAAGWLFGIAAHVLARSVRRGRIEDRARRRIGLPPVTLDDAQLAEIDATGDDTGVLAALDQLPPEQREAIRARILDDRAYPDVAARLDISEAVARKRVSRGLAALRRTLEETSR